LIREELCKYRKVIDVALWTDKAFATVIMEKYEVAERFVDVQCKIGEADMVISRTPFMPINDPADIVCSRRILCIR
jgi:hypothetical protein